MAKRGRPVGSAIRQNIIDLLGSMGKAYGYQLHKEYNKRFSPCTRESVYYHLKKGVKLGSIKLHDVTQEEGNYSWGNSVEKRYYTLTKDAIVKQEYAEEFQNGEQLD